MTPAGPLSRRAAALDSVLARQQAQLAALNRLRSGEVTLPDFLSGPSATTGEIRVLLVLEALPGVGPRRARKAMNRLGISEYLRLRSLSPRQIDRLKALFTDSPRTDG